MPIVKCRAAGVMAYDQAGEWVGWFADAGSARRELLARDLNPPASVGSGLAHCGAKAAGLTPVGPAVSSTEAAA